MGWCRRNGTKAGEVQPEMGRTDGGRWVEENDNSDDDIVHMLNKDCDDDNVGADCLELNCKCV